VILDKGPINSVECFPITFLNGKAWNPFPWDSARYMGVRLCEGPTIYIHNLHNILEPILEWRFVSCGKSLLGGVIVLQLCRCGGTIKHKLTSPKRQFMI
jgi:hypothetical protein